MLSKEQRKRECGSPDPQDVEIYQEIINILSSVGYHRARVTHLTPYDKIVGGISWMLSLFQPFVGGESWVFREMNDKPDNVKVMEVNQIIQAIENMENAAPVFPDFFLMPNMAVQRNVVLWLVNKVSESDKTQHNYNLFLSSFNNELYDVEEDAINEIMYNFRCQERSTRCDRIDLFDKSIFRDKLVTGWMILAEFINYERTGKRIYPKFMLRRGEDFDTQQDEVLEMNRAKLQEIANDIVATLQTSVAKEFANKVASSIEDLKIADLMTQTESRVLSECKKYYADFNEYSTLKEKSRNTQKTVYKKLDVSKRNIILIKLVPTIHKAFHTLYKAREQRNIEEPKNEETGEGIDDQLAEDCLLVNRKVDGALALVNSLRPINELSIFIILTAFYSFVIDVRSQWTNWYWKASMLIEQRHEMQSKLLNLNHDEKKAQREAQYGKIEEEQIKKLEDLLISAKKDFDLWEKESPEFQRLHPSDGSNKDDKPDMNWILSSGRKIATRANKFSKQ
uniref:Coiled-coil domain-containing protein 93 n=1 Tax=Caenorhabditis tropicalis TaxID=1561998 RepID=A0A1I7TRC2_9PELO